MALLSRLARLLVTRPKIRHINGNKGLLDISSLGDIDNYETYPEYDDDIVTFRNCTGKGAQELNQWVVHPVFPKARLIVMDRCDPTFVYYNTCLINFLRAEAILINGDPKGQMAVATFLYGYENEVINHQGTVYLPRPIYLRYLNHWYSEDDTFVRPIGDLELKTALRVVSLPRID